MCTEMMSSSDFQVLINIFCTLSPPVCTPTACIHMKQLFEVCTFINMCQDTRHIYRLRTAFLVILLLLSEGLHWNEQPPLVGISAV